MKTKTPYEFERAGLSGAASPGYRSGTLRVRRNMWDGTERHVRVRDTYVHADTVLEPDELAARRIYRWLGDQFEPHDLDAAAVVELEVNLPKGTRPANTRVFRRRPGVKVLGVVDCAGPRVVDEYSVFQQPDRFDQRWADYQAKLEAQDAEPFSLDDDGPGYVAPGTYAAFADEERPFALAAYDRPDDPVVDAELDVGTTGADLEALVADSAITLRRHARDAMGALLDIGETVRCEGAALERLRAGTADRNQGVRAAIDERDSELHALLTRTDQLVVDLAAIVDDLL